MRNPVRVVVAGRLSCANSMGIPCFLLNDKDASLLVCCNEGASVMFKRLWQEFEGGDIVLLTGRLDHNDSRELFLRADDGCFLCESLIDEQSEHGAAFLRSMQRKVQAASFAGSVEFILTKYFRDHGFKMLSSNPLGQDNLTERPSGICLPRALAVAAGERKVFSLEQESTGEIYLKAAWAYASALELAETFRSSTETLISALCAEGHFLSATSRHFSRHQVKVCRLEELFLTRGYASMTSAEIWQVLEEEILPSVTQPLLMTSVPPKNRFTKMLPQGSSAFVIAASARIVAEGFSFDNDIRRVATHRQEDMTDEELLMTCAYGLPPTAIGTLYLDRLAAALH